MTAEELNIIAENALNDQYKKIINQLKESAIKGKNSCIIKNLPTSISKKLKEKGFVIIPIYKYRYNYFLFKKRRIKYFLIQF
ncbi:hypothetical protein HX045_05730 [Myroides odoratimimus]|uniref:Uncharacterized protein n=2 Tax=Myroides odoratimimus TaxID=76832 RepID=A0A0S7EES5_9FLAO|nr:MULTISPECIES: hypothetical protein [Myroides]AJA69938.1 hypothetical protein MYRA21_2829 [Myroides sp. A21]ALU27178.1 hypothetical protein AS202_13865 [Myroides odoratimimus]APA93203.1 hypothetical protein BK054_13415 [Myroides sp. ZB35]EHO08481.1 hypothetical protein HMPREF9712_02143 [Myroides odoratimimus CCUG 10230]EKB07147.1 hypothetical protein HMPREF9711_00457 [Myroides odoratimimus CCUG 3837]